MKRIVVVLLSVLLSVFITACDCKDQSGTDVTQPPSSITPPQTTTDEAIVSKLVIDFGSKLREVSLLAPREIVQDSMIESYGNYISEELLSKWQNNPKSAPGRLTSTPWPDRIEIQSVIRINDNTYQVKGEIIEISSTEKPATGAVSRQPITLIVGKLDSRWVITDVMLNNNVENNNIIYQNDEFGFTFTLPISWKGFLIVSGKWEGLAVDGDNQGQVVETGPVLSIRHPLWTEKIPRQDIPIMIFTLNQWNLLQQEKIHIGAAPIGPSVLGHSHQYYFALPARYNYAFPEGYEEVNQIIESHPLHIKD